MDEITVAREFGDRITFLAGLDVQHVLKELHLRRFEQKFAG
jgi:hypothetical protein